jgi:hypothetical protein
VFLKLLRQTPTMKFAYYDLGQLGAGATVIIGLPGTEANVQLLDSANFAKYRDGDPSWSYVGGHYTESPVRLVTPHPGHWYAAVDLGGARGNVESRIIGVYQAAA